MICGGGSARCSGGWAVSRFVYKDRAVIVFPARSRGALRGYSCDSLILDECQYLTNAQHEAVLPTLSARPNTQQWHVRNSANAFR